jgi:DNA-binding response OmpR family regulator
LNLDALLVMPTGEPRLVLSEATGTVTLDGHSVVLPPREFELLWLLCKRAPRGKSPVHSRDILDAMYRGTVATGVTVRSLKRDLQNSLKDLLTRARFPEPLILTPGGPGYAITLAAEDILLIEA